MTGSKPADRSRGAQGRGGGRVTARGFVLADRQAGAYGKVDVRRVFHVEQQRKSEAAEWVLAYAKNAARILKYPRFCSYSVARAGVGWLAGCEVPVRAASYSAGGT